MTLEVELPGHESDDRGAMLANISRRVVGLHKEYYGKGPTKAKTYLQGDLVVVLLRGGFTRVEETLLQEGRRDDVMRQRQAFQDVMVERFKAVVAEETGRKVVAFMSANHQGPDMSAELFVLAPEAGAEEPYRPVDAPAV